MEPRLGRPWRQRAAARFGVAPTALVLSVAASVSAIGAAPSGAAAEVTISGAVGFSPPTVNIQVGETVRWINVGGFHSVESCDGVDDPPFCEGQVAAEGFFSSGPPSFPGEPYERTFNQVGSNPYFCAFHFQTGNVVVSGPDAPPIVPDGATGTPVVLDKLDDSGATLVVDWDDQSCGGAAQYVILFGTSDLLPPFPGGPFGAMAACNVGNPPYVWSGSPDPDALGLVWLLVVGTNGAGTEGPWGTDSLGVERQGPGPGGCSLQCGVTVKDGSNPCP